MNINTKRPNVVSASGYTFSRHLTKRKPKRATKREPRSVRPSKVPKLLRDGAFYESLDVEDDSPIQVPALNVKTTVRTNRDLDELLSCLRFWGVATIPDRTLVTLVITSRFCITETLVNKFKVCFPILDSIYKFQRLRENGCMIGKAILVGSSELVEFLLRRKFEFPANACDVAAASGSLQCLQLAHQRGIAVTATTFKNAARKGDLNIVKYLHDILCPHEPDVVEEIARSGNVETLKYAIDQNIPFVANHKVCSSLVRDNYFEAMKCMHSIGYSLRDVLDLASMHNRLNFLQYAHEHGAQWVAQHVYVAAAHGHAECVQYAIEHGCPYDPVTLAKLRMD